MAISSDAISADAGYRSPMESKRRGPAIGEYEVPGPVPARDLLARERGTQLSVGAALPLTGGVLSR